MREVTYLHRLAEEVVGPVNWESEFIGTCACPGRESHTTPNQETDCRIYLEGRPHLHCFHSSCQERRTRTGALLQTKLGNLPGRKTQGLCEPKPRPPEVRFNPVDAEKVASLVSSRIDARWLIRRSPIPVQELTPDDVLSSLYERSESVLIFVGTQRSQGIIWRAGIRPFQAIRHAEGAWFLNQPVDGKWRRKPDGRLTRRSSECVSAWRFMVVESDVVPEAMWLRIIVQLPLPVVAIYSSGGKSIHALIRIDATSRDDWQRRVSEWKSLLIRLGADPQSLSALRNTRLPQAYRGDQLQKLLFLNPAASTDPICRSNEIR